MHEQVNKLWFLENNKKELFRSIFAVVETIDDNQAWRKENYLLYSKYYLNRNIKSLSPAASMGLEAAAAFNNRMTYNVVKMSIDAIASKIAKQKPRVFFLTSEGNFEQQERGKNLTKYVDAIFEQNKVFSEGQRVFIDACVYGTGVFKVSASDGKVIVERVCIDDILVDEVEATDGKPEQIHQRYRVPRHKLKQLFPKFKNEIEDAEAFDDGEQALSDRIEVIESWKVPSSKSASDGMHCISIKNATLLTEEYTKDYFPFAFMHWSKPLNGFYGESLVYEIMEIQDALTKVLDTILEGQTLMAVPRWFIRSDTTVNEDDINDMVGSFIRYQGAQPPIAGVAPGASPELYTFARELFEKAFEVAGVSLLSATSRKPAGIESGKAMMVYSDIETERFALTGQAYQELFMDVAQLVVNVSKELYGSNKKAKVSIRDKEKFYSQVFWKDIDLEEDVFQLCKYSTNFLPKEPSGQLQAVIDMVKAGMVSKEESMALFDYPDTESFYRKATAKLRIAEKLVSNILLHGKYVEPEKYMDLEILAMTAQERYLDALVSEDVPEENIELLRTFMDQLADKLGANPPPQDDPPPGPPPPPGEMMPPPGPPPPPPPGAPPMPPA